MVILQKVLEHSSLAIAQNYYNILICDIKKDMCRINEIPVSINYNNKYIIT